MERVRVFWTCPKCNLGSRASWSEATGEIVCSSCHAQFTWNDVLSADEILNLVGGVPYASIESDIKRFCPVCGGELGWMGELGRKKRWYRCQKCGVDVAQETHEQDSSSG